jgi:hypothetical protein
MTATPRVGGVVLPPRPSIGTPGPGELERLFALQRAHRWTMARTTAAQRVDRLKRLKASVLRHETELHEAVHRDFRKAPPETDISELLVFRLEVEHAIRHLRRWMRPQRVATPWILTGTRSSIRCEPRGVVLILAPWNYPIGLVLNPLVAAIAAGNCAIVRPSEKTRYTARVLRQVVAEALPEEEAAVVLGDVDTAQALLTLPFDHVFFTGSSRIGQLVMRYAAEHLTSVTLELGGKTPALLDRSADVARAAEAIMWGKFLNAGQTCLAPDYVLVPPELEEPFIAESRRVLTRFLGIPLAPGARLLPHQDTRLPAARGRPTLLWLRDHARRGRRPGRAVPRADARGGRHRRHAADARGDLRTGAAAGALRHAGRRDRVRERPPQAARAVRLRAGPRGGGSGEHGHQRRRDRGERRPDPLRQPRPAVRRRGLERPGELPRPARLPGVLARAGRDRGSRPRDLAPLPPALRQAGAVGDRPDRAGVRLSRGRGPCGTSHNG